MSLEEFILKGEHAAGAAAGVIIFLLGMVRFRKKDEAEVRRTDTDTIINSAERTLQIVTNGLDRAEQRLLNLESRVSMLEHERDDCLEQLRILKNANVR